MKVIYFYINIYYFTQLEYLLNTFLLLLLAKVVPVSLHHRGAQSASDGKGREAGAEGTEQSEPLNSAVEAPSARTCAQISFLVFTLNHYKMSTKRMFFTAVLGLAFAASVAAQEGAWRHYRTLENVNEVAESPTDYWLATKHGVVRVDKATHDKTWMQPYNSTITGELISAVAVSPTTGLPWIGANKLVTGQPFAGGYHSTLMRWEGGQFVQEVFPADITAQIDAAFASINTIKFAPNGDIWVGISIGVLVKSGNTWSLISAETFANQPEITMNGIWDISFDDLGNTFLAGNSLIRRDAEGNFFNVNGNDFTLFNFNNAHVESRGSRTYYMSDQGGIGIYEGATTLFIGNLVEMTGFGTGGCNPSTSSFMKAPNNDVLLNMPDNELVYKFVDFTLVPYNNDVITSAGNRPNQVWEQANGTKRSVKADMVWWQTPTSGAQVENDRLSNQLFSSAIYSVAQGENDKIYAFGPTNTDDPGIISVYDYTTDAWSAETGPIHSNYLKKDDQGRLWMASTNAIYLKEGDTWVNKSEQFNQPAEITYINYFSVAGDHIWLTFDYDLYHYDGTAWHKLSAANSALYASGYINQLEATADGSCYFVQYDVNSANQGYDLRIIDPQGNFTTVDLMDELNAYYFTCLKVAPDGTIWATDFANLHHYDGTNWTTFGSEVGWSDIYYPYVMTIVADNHIILGTAEDGVVMFKDNQVSSMNTENSELTDNHVVSLEMDNISTLWIGVENIGLDAFSLTNFQPNSTTNQTTHVNGLLTALPNPTENTSVISWTQTKAAQQVSLELFDVQGRKIETVSLGALQTGKHDHTFDLSSRPAGMYFVKIALDNTISTTAVVKK